MQGPSPTTGPCGPGCQQKGNADDTTAVTPEGPGSQEEKHAESIELHTPAGMNASQARSRDGESPNTLTLFVAARRVCELSSCKAAQGKLSDAEHCWDAERETWAKTRETHAATKRDRLTELPEGHRELQRPPTDKWRGHRQAGTS